MAMIKNLLFDLGGVIMDIDRNRAVHALEAIGLTEADSLLGEYGQKGAFLALEKGEIDAAEFRRQLRPLFNRPVSDSEIDEAFTRFLIGIPQHRLKALRELRKRYKVYMLSNTNPIMFEGFITDQFRQEGLEMSDYFDGVVTSYEAKCYKPDKEIFDYACAHCGIKPEETLFFDDSQSNVNAARALGFNAALVAPGTEFTDIIGNILD